MWTTRFQTRSTCVDGQREISPIPAQPELTRSGAPQLRRRHSASRLLEGQAWPSSARRHPAASRDFMAGCLGEEGPPPQRANCHLRVLSSSRNTRATGLLTTKHLNPAKGVKSIKCEKQEREPLPDTMADAFRGTFPFGTPRTAALRSASRHRPADRRRAENAVGPDRGRHNPHPVGQDEDTSDLPGDAELAAGAGRGDAGQPLHPLQGHVQDEAPGPVDLSGRDRRDAGRCRGPAP